MKTTTVCLLIGLLLPLMATAADTGRGITVAPVSATAPSGNAGLFVGVNQFAEDTSLRPLNFAVNDAIAQAHLFVVELKLLPPANACVALSGEPTGDAAKSQLDALAKAGVQRVGAGRTRIVSSLLRISSMARDRDDLVVVSMSSHGFEEQGAAYVLPADGLRGALRVTGLSLAGVEEQLAQSKAGKRLLLIDACREQPTTESRGASDAMSSTFRSALAAAEGQAVLASCDAGQLSIENAELGHGVFTHFLLQALRGQAAADARGFITLGTVSDYVAQSVHDWVLRNRPALDRRAAQQPWFKGPKIAEQIPLAVDPGVRARLGAFKQDVMTTLSALRAKVSGKSEFNFALYERLADALDKVQDDETGRKLLQHSKDFLSGKIGEDFFVGFLQRTLETPEQRTARLERETAGRQARERLAKIAALLATAQANDNKENGKMALEALHELLKFEPAHKAALALREKIRGYYARQPGETMALDLGNGVKMDFCWIPAGEFMMGSTDGGDNEKPVHRVQITKGFWMGKFEVTQAQYGVIMGTNPSSLKGVDLPVDRVSWDDAVEFCKRLSQNRGLTLRLPTEAEWEYTCRAGSNTKYCTGDNGGDLGNAGWYMGNSDNKMHPVGQKAPNKWGVCDTHGNVREWCADWYAQDYYWKGEDTDPKGPSTGEARILRGGAYLYAPGGCRSASRYWSVPGGSFEGFGFRVCVDYQ